MLNALMEANENAKELTGLWKQTGEELMLEKASFISKSRSLLQEICTETLEKKFAIFVLHQCLTGELIHKIPRFNVGSGFRSSRQQ